jgi:hypothetical protein
MGHIPRLSRFNYFYTEGINPKIKKLVSGNRSDILHKELSASYESKFIKDENEIYEYAKKDNMVFEAAWVGKQVSLWRREGKKEKVKRLFSAYLDDRGQKLSGPKADVLKKVERDVGIFKGLVEGLLAKKSRAELVRKLKSKFHIGKGEQIDEKTGKPYPTHPTEPKSPTIEEIYDNYLSAVEKYFLKRPTKPNRVMGVKEAIELANAQIEQKKKNRAKSLTKVPWKQVWPWFDTMLANLRWEVKGGNKTI